ncbi:hypothetical protein [Hymenobacter guriensis]|uniref:Uncharacterized protein n=1 Tax=Hymenobacter guriensis TaxID=2793065 RepID=A0ABS0KY12_9BACT|nr:hypothetical protein [Hymenobacter guriensis]MBG8552746.1 hypothetical protein [Hymenobacter guriensis]
MKASIVLVVLGTSGLFSCAKDNPEKALTLENSTVLFGSYYDECGGEQCIEIYKLDTVTQSLSEDTKDDYPTSASPYDGTYVARTTAEFDAVKDLVQQIPLTLLAKEGVVIGQPDAGDWGGYYLEVQNGEERRYWLIDTKKENLPAYLHSFTDVLRARLNQLQ